MKAHLWLIVILVLATIFRVYNLGNNPPAAYGDEISFAWNAWNILKTGTDEYGTPLPLQFRAFDDYKSPIPVYLLVPFFQLFGMNTFILRLPVALFGAATIWVTFLLVKKLLNERIGLLAAALLAISPWHMHLSRGYFESTIALFFFVTAVYFFVSNFYSGLDLAFAYYTTADPGTYRAAKQNRVILEKDKEFINFGKFYIGSLDIDNERMSKGVLPVKSLYIARPEEMPSDEVIRDPTDGRVLFYVYRTN